MPELPEVEVTRLSLVDRLEGARLLGLRLGKPLRWPLGVAPLALAGARIGRLQRRGKYLWMPLGTAGDASREEAVEGGEPAETPGLLIHLGMSGALRLDAELPPAGPHDHVDWLTDRGTLRLHDPRRFGAVVWSPGRDLDPAARLLAGLGVEPLEPGFTAERLHAGLQGRRVAVKHALLAGDVVVGVGNIYCSEALFAAGIDPRTAAGRVSLLRCRRLAQAIREVLQRAVTLGGSTLRDFHDAHGHGGAFQTQAQVYGRAGQPCRRCGGTVQRIVQGQRASYFCPGCQHR
ncbi:bifunctional DNA-formamidopyrimidine glycosylase/DNA-(apurinic or apyrimidinic site) lyase [Sphaerotilus microaerophilus]|jgi:formamidopyrimidine-DNA glycosylase|uniref:Formamidopyrimidine-DNA glycosylase n=1 Tax=Sphaerotilus microaerophilus TaxID=2914710 RepID=A0ABM7YIA7_9BURK|nr:bifunctional DNA-formamidopyrimidine glycosylase/DNA-(apurinic or apyrimidinic site) lyase [Sphaerotilus sp. FB-5]BDI04117.1 formamidopyrimidine-DNA glycosylase [Sphaerotilus sp. FB-5]